MSGTIRTLAVFTLFFGVLRWNLCPPWWFSGPGRPVCIEFHPLNWTPVLTDELAPPQVFFDLLLAGDVVLCLALGLVLAFLGKRSPARV